MQRATLDAHHKVRWEKSLSSEKILVIALCFPTGAKMAQSSDKAAATAASILKSLAAIIYKLAVVSSVPAF